MKRLLWVLTFSFGAPTVMAWAFVLLFSLSPRSPLPPLPQVLGATAPIYAPNSIALPELRPSVTTANARIAIIEKYLGSRRSPLLPYARYLVEISDKYGLDYRLLVAIARQESQLCKVIPDNSHNCWGYGIYGDKVTRFTSYQSAIDTVARGLKVNYIDHGLTTPEEIMAKYTPPSAALGGPWATAVSQFLSELE